ncbi:hypothetical protein SUGI_0335250 [Cryptomeria japonica]|uniref:uncharacterized protein LOC131036760 n=1 Tax=Cryptomeria japonica TaxID=3369 RepID=UPI002408D6CB|nr:uncharacterized protein LOC131036760 [Cryptomeria japonica]GLJ18774.1 hypothetical protein SUGI_0335250 [Cryptomeria japonica]
MAEFKIFSRSLKTRSGWRLATVKEAEENRESIKSINWSTRWDRARLLDGWIGGSAYDFRPKVGFRSCVGYMLLTKQSHSPLSEISSSDEMGKGWYSEVTLTEEGRRAALFLCCEDWNYEVVCWLLNCWSKPGKQKLKINSKGEKAAASELVSVVARELQITREMKRERRIQFSKSSVKVIMSSILECLEKAVPNEILREILLRMKVLDLGGQCWKEMGLTDDLSRFQQFGFKTMEASTREDIADVVCHVAADSMAVAIIRHYISSNDANIDRQSSTGLRQRMGDLEFVASVLAYANQILHKSYHGYDSLWGIVEKAAKAAHGDCKILEEILLRDQEYGTFSYDGKYGVLNKILVQAAKKGDLNVVERLTGCGIQALETDDKRGKTALHHAAKLDTNSQGVDIAEALLRNGGVAIRELANARDYKHRTPLHRAALSGHARMCKLLIRYHSSTHAQDKNERIPLHYALGREQQNEELIAMLMSADAEEVDEQDRQGKTPLDLAVECHASNIRMVTWLLSLSSQPEHSFKKLHLSAFLRESSRRGYRDLLVKLLNAGANPVERDNEGKTALHYAAECRGESEAKAIIKELMVFDEEGQVKCPELVTARDNYGRSVLHIAAFIGHKSICQMLLSLDGLALDTKDHDGQSAVYYAVAGTHDDDQVLDALLFPASSKEVPSIADHIDSSGTTPLHVAAAAGNIKMVGKLLSKRLISKSQQREHFVRAADVLGQTALHKAACGGHKRVVQELLDKGAHPLNDRDCDGKTALHYAVQAENDEDALGIAQLVLSKCGSDDEKSLLLCASAVGIGTAEETLANNSPLKTYLKDERSGRKGNLLRAAAKLANIDMTRELLTGGARISDITSSKWRAKLTPMEDQKVEHVLKQIHRSVEQRTDEPTLRDNLGRSAFANGLAALFLNPYVKPPITVGISGEWGMGKSSLMMQTESVLLKTSAQLAFSHSLQVKGFLGARKPKLSTKGESIRRSMRRLSISKRTEDESLHSPHANKDESTSALHSSNAKKDESKLDIFQKLKGLVKCLFSAVKDNTRKRNREVKIPLGDFSGSYNPKYHAMYKHLAVIDRTDMFEEEEEEENESTSSDQSERVCKEESKRQGQEQMQIQGTIPSILTVRYNAWQYRNESDAWAGLAVNVTRELEATMTVAQKLRTGWRYNWTTRKRQIFLGVILPSFLAVIMAIWFTIILWLILDKAKGKDLKQFKYGSLPATVIVVMWAVVRSVISIVEPISSQMVDYICLPNHADKLGYHHKVISDIKFLKKEIGNKPSRLWNAFSFLWCCATFCWNDDYIQDTPIPKMAPASSDNLRIVVFVDDLDRCQENVILQILSAINLVLAACEINVVLGMDKRMIENAIIKKFGNQHNKPPNKCNEALADKYLRKIIQLPLDLPDPSHTESKNFLQGQLGISDTCKGPADCEAQADMPPVHAHRKMNPKFRLGTFISRNPKLGGGETVATRGETGDIRERDDVSGTESTGQGTHFELLNTTEHGQCSTEISEQGLAEAETKIMIQSETSSGIKGGEQGDPISKTEKDRTWMRWCMGKLRSCFFYKCNRGEKSNTEIEDELMEIFPITIEMLIPQYSKGESDAFCFLETKTTGARKLPREWKRLLTYHRLAWNILSKSTPVKTLAGWQVQLIAWVFVCWQWKDQIDTLVQEWDNLRVLKNWITVNDNQQGEMIQGKTSGPSLREIVEQYMDERWPAVAKSGSTSVSNADGIKGSIPKQSPAKENDSIKIHTENGKGQESEGKGISNGTSNINSMEEEDKGGLKYLMEVIGKVLKEEEQEYSLKLQELEGKKGEDPEEWLKIVIRLKILREEKQLEEWLKAIVRNVLKEGEEANAGERSLQQDKQSKEEKQGASQKQKRKGKRKAVEDEEEREEWRKLRDTLSRYNVTMDGLQAFQKFRFYCVPGDLPWPLPKQEDNHN